MTDSTSATGRADGALPATGEEIRTILGPIDDTLLASLLAVGATSAEVLEAQTWLNSDDYLHRSLHHGQTGRVAALVEILEAEEPEEPD